MDRIRNEEVGGGSAIRLGDKVRREGEVDSGWRESLRKEGVKLASVRDRCRLKSQVEPSDGLWPNLKGSAQR